ncbi:MAG: NgoFVII family restriction endonuclease [Acidimicrobiaceae bacterium]|nr:phospholipase D-like domain-containing protein [Acidimicrobiaceae bacterium]MYA73614.1 NgoFVII family restriction endonuclease [Acidimicrobiaceae bacterium]MYG54120.1 NgoFVII family restriction endonuclease [Acidimicrobiaceae bacterium]MYJ98981.1 NgoFVII family restriction endonuclease [Acidimicrobiaceae bacterium]
MPKILDNIENETERELLETLRSSHRLDAAIGYFNLRGWALLAEAVDALPERPEGPKARILVGIHEAPREEMRRLTQMRQPDPVDNRTAVRTKGETVSEYRDQLQVGLPTQGDETALRALLRQIEAGHVEVRVHTAHRLHAKLYLCHRDDTAAPRVGYVGSSNLTVAGLREQGELNVDVVDSDATDKLARWFEERWNDPFTVDAMPELAETLRESWASEDQLDPYLVYLKMAFHLSKEAREGLIEYGLPASMQDQLLDFQAAAVKIAARIVMQKGGAMIGDVVGLGKTLVGTAVARLLQEEQGFETLVVCPKNLVDMWKSYLHTYEVRGDVESLSMVHKTLPDARRYRLVIVDEAHNLRSDKRRDHGALQSYIADNDSRVLLLSATPYNKQLGDLASQLSLFIRPDDDLGLRPERAIAEVVEADFELMCEGRTSTLNAFKRSEYLEDWQDLMSQYLVRRTRRFVEENYAEPDELGRRYLQFGTGQRFYFPKRIAKPTERILTEDDPAHVMASDDTLNAIRDLRLPRYQLGNYIDSRFEAPDDDIRQLVDDLDNSARGNLAGFTRITMFKRLSSSGPAFIATLRRHRLRNQVAAHALNSNSPVPIGSVDNALWATEVDSDPEDNGDGDGGMGLFDSDDGTAASAYRKLRAKDPKAIRWAPHSMFDGDLLNDLQHDIDVITGMLNRFGTWAAERDGKVAALESLIKYEYPDSKLLVFTEAADTANYVCAELERRGVDGVGVVTGDSENPTALAQRFSPVSNNVVTNGSPLSDELRVLVSTDVLSEGQNLQDAHIVVNYDLPWAIVKLVQRAGRVDRIGQNSSEVLVYSLMPADEIEEEISLRDRIRERLGENARLLGSDERFFGDPTESQIISGVYDESSSFGLAGAGMDDVDPVSMAYEIWRHAKDSNPNIAQRVESMPNIVYSTKRTTDNEPDTGVLVHTQAVTGTDVFAFVEPSGQARRVTPQVALRLAECKPDTPSVTRLEDHHDLTAAARGGPLRTPSGRATGALQGVRGKVWRRLHDQMDRFTDNLLFSKADLEKAHDAMNERPLYEAATQRLAQAARERSTDDLARLVVDLHKDNRLCMPPPSEGTDADPAIVCTMGFRER